MLPICYFAFIRTYVADSYLAHPMSRTWLTSTCSSVYFFEIGACFSASRQTVTAKETCRWVQKIKKQKSAGAEMRIKLRKIRVKYQTTPLDTKKTSKHHEKVQKRERSLVMAREIASEICGLAPYEKKATDLIKSDQERKCKRFLKKRLGSLRRAKRKQQELTELLNQ